MAKMRTVTLRHLTSVAQVGGEEEMSNILRDILPDKSFLIHGIIGYMESQSDTETSMQIFKNRARAVAPVEEIAPFSQHGVIYVMLTRSITIKELLVMFPEPLDFDKDDSLNMLFKWSTIGAGARHGITVTFLYSEKK